MSMFCYQCEQTAGQKACAGQRGVCGKEESTANLQDQLTGALVTMSKLANGKAPHEEAVQLMLEGLFTTITNVSFDDETLQILIDRVEAENKKMGLDPIFDMNLVWNESNEDVRSLKSLILFGLRGVAAYAFHARVLGYTDEKVNAIFFEGMAALAENWGMDQLLPLVMKVGEINLTCMELLDKANTESYGTPTPVTVPMTVEKGPFIVISGHDLKDLEILLKQTEGKGINIYTHGEMLPAHGYPKLKAYPHLKGNFGTAWQNQQKEFMDIPAPVLFTTNCLMPPKDNYKDRIFTTEVVEYPGLVHIGEDKDFSAVIEKALELGGYP